MINYFKLELKRAIFSKYFLLSFSIILLLLIYSFFEFISFGWSNNLFNLQFFKEHYDFIDMFIFSRSENRASYLTVIAPLLASLVFSDSYLSDKTSGYIKFIYIRINKKIYVLIRILVNIIASGLSILLASLFMLLILIFFYGIEINPENALNMSGAFSSIYYTGNKYVYLLLILICSFVFNSIFATLSLSISAFINNKYLSFLIPFFYYIISGSIFVAIGFYKLNATFLFMFKGNMTFLDLLIYALFLFISSIIFFAYGVLRKDEKNN